ncbi:MAG: DegT/DnrJ/EryC1/StrS family aminotransferase [Methylococcales bacterium]
MNSVSTQQNDQELITLPSDQEASGRTLGEEEITLAAEAIRSGTLTSTKGQFTKQLEKRFAEQVGAKHAYACSSGTAAVHTAVAAINPNPGDEIITTSITDMGGLTSILYQGAIPVFADVDPKTCNVTAETIKARLSEKTKAILVTHLFGNPCDMGPILQLAKDKNIPIIEDCAQAYQATWEGRHVGTLGDIGCFSLQQGKHITCGEGGLVTTNDDALARHSFLFVNKAWGYGDEKPDHYFLAPNYRLSEVQGAVALAQMEKLAAGVNQRIALAEQMNEAIQALPGLEPLSIYPDCVNTYWRYCLLIDENIIAGGSPAIGASLRKKNIASAPRYIQKPAFSCEIFAKQRTFGDSRFPFTLARPEAVDYSPELFPGTFEALEKILVLPWNERYTEEHVDYIAKALQSAVKELSGGNS